MRRVLVILLVAPLAFGGAAYAMLAATTFRKARFALSVSPSTQTVARGGNVSFSVELLRAEGFKGQVRLRVVGLPAQVRARWQTPAGRTSAVIAPGEHAALLTLRALPRSRPRTRRVIVWATGDGRTVRRGLLLTIARPAQRRFSLLVSPRRQVVRAGAAGWYKVRVARARGFRSRVKLRVLGLPRGAGVRISGASVAIRAAAGEEPATHQLVIQGTSRLGKLTVRRYAVVVLTVVAPAVGAADTVGGDPEHAMYPGASAPIDLRLTNSHAYQVRVTNLRVSVRAATSNPGCSGDDYGMTQFAGAYPLVLRPGTTRLSALVGNSALWPRLAMHDLPRNQDACKGADVGLDYTMQLTR